MAIINTLCDTLTSYVIATAGVLQEWKILLKKSNELVCNAKHMEI